jgi:copper homeostasis protein
VEHSQSALLRCWDDDTLSLLDIQPTARLVLKNSPLSKTATLEIAATSLVEARTAVAGGAASLEICRDLGAGGLTAPLQLVQAIRDVVPVTLNVMIRVHNQGFVYTADELEAMLEEIEQVKALGVDGVVFGALTMDGDLDMQQMWTVVRAAAPLPVTLHRALDVCRTPDTALRALVGIVPRVLTAGPATTAWEGRGTLKRWVETYGKNYRFAASGGITLEQLPELVRVVGADEYHIGGAARTKGVVDVAKVQQLQAVLDQYRDRREQVE